MEGQYITLVNYRLKDYKKDEVEGTNRIVIKFLISLIDLILLCTEFLIILLILVNGYMI